MGQSQTKGQDQIKKDLIKYEPQLDSQVKPNIETYLNPKSIEYICLTYNKITLKIHINKNDSKAKIVEEVFETLVHFKYILKRAKKRNKRM